MRRTMVVTDITRMHGDRICVGGYLEDGSSIRPVCGRHGPTEAWLQPTRDELVVPFSILEVTVGPSPVLVAPHTEDRLVPEFGHQVIETLSKHDAWAQLEWSESPSVRSIFGAEVHSDNENRWGRYVRAGEGHQSLGTIRAAAIRDVQYRHFDDRDHWDYRLRFVDASGEEFQLTVVDLNFRRRLDARRSGLLPPDRIGHSMRAALQKQTVFLRIGLASGWERHPDRCYLQITGVYGFDGD